MRHVLSRLPYTTWQRLWPLANEHTYQQFQASTLDLAVWGGTEQILAAAALYRVTIRVHTPFGLQA